MDDNMAKNRRGIVIADTNEAVAAYVADGTKYCKMAVLFAIMAQSL